jgi:DNA repair protein RecO (recombination protein O)
MLHKTKGIVLKTTDYAENSVIAKIFTQKFGLQSYLINGVKKPKAKIRLNMLQPLHILDLVVYHKPNSNIQRISDARSEPILQTIPYDIIKSSLVLFMNEVIYKSLKQEHEEPIMFEFIAKSIELLDQTENGVANFHLIFLMKLTRFLGFYPDMSNADSSSFFDLKNGIFVNHQPLHLSFVETQQMENWLQILRNSIDDFLVLKLSSASRKYLLQKVLAYYALHIESFGDVKSLAILEEVLS